ncbi:MAG: hypothetical protein AABX13_01370 [Nanoarchaeota archaeon]
MESEKISGEKISRQHLPLEKSLEKRDSENNSERNIGKKEPGKALSYLLVIAVGMVLIFSVLQSFQLSSLNKQVNQLAGKVASAGSNTGSTGLSTGLDMSSWTENEKMMYEHHGTLPARLPAGKVNVQSENKNAKNGNEKLETLPAMVGGC